LAFPKEFHHEGANYETGAHPHLSTSAEVLNREQVLTIHTAALQILEKTGFKMEHLGTLEIVADAGSKVSNGDWIRLSAYLVEEALSSAPRQIALHGQRGNKTMLLANGNYFYGTGSDATFSLDLRHPKLMKCTKKSIKSFKDANKELRHGNEFAILQAAYT
jgi:trimethylamine:corrinoid methyltransferase-like protein